MRIHAKMGMCWLALSLPMGLTGEAAERSDLRAEFVEPPFEYGSRPLWFWNGPLAADRTRDMLAACKARGYAGAGILPAQGMSPAFMTPPFLSEYAAAVEEAARLGMKLCLYDEYWFPSGSAGGLLAERHPEALSKRLDQTAVDVTGPKEIVQAVPAGTLMGAVAMERATKERVDISDRVKEGKLVWDVPPGEWTIMLFTCVRDGARGLVDYLDPEAVRRFISLTYQAYYEKFPAHFGTTIDSAFYDEPTFHWVEGGRAWTERFNEEFRERYGRDPVIFYPALWFDIGPDTAAARNALFGLRAELYATGFPKIINEWCREHRIQLTGHVDQEEIVNPVLLCGDLMKAFRHQDIPGIDQIFQYGRASKAYKIISSAAYNYDRPLVLTECYGAIAGMPAANLYKEAMDQFAKGINVMVPHAVWYAPASIIFPPDLSPGNATYGPHLPAYNQYIARLQRMLQGGRHIADIGVLYPIATLQAGTYFGPGKPYEGGVIPPEADYMDVGERLALAVRRDFTFIHPEVLDEKCDAGGARIRMKNGVNHEEYRVFIIPGSRAVHWSNLRKIKAFFDEGGKVIATTRLPDTSAEFGKDDDVRKAVAEMFGADAGKRPDAPRATASSSWAAGGYDPLNAVDGDPETRWNAADGTKGDQWLEVDFGEARTFDRTVIREAFDRTTAYRIEWWDGSAWRECARGGRIGPRKIDTFRALKASRVRLYIEAIASDSVSIREFEIREGAGPSLASCAADPTVQANANGGKAWFAPSPKADVLKTILDDGVPVPDVQVMEDVEVSGGNFSYIHKVMEGRHIYFFANSSDTPVDVPVRMRGRLALERWDPHTGEISACEATIATEAACDTTRIRLRLAPVRSVFLVSAARETLR